MARVFSLVVAVHDVAPYLHEFLASLEAQTYGCENLQVVFVDDGSTDESGKIVARWADGREQHVTVLEKRRGGQASARNLGLEHATGEWVTFPDPDDVLAPDYFAHVHALLDAHADRPASMYAGRILVLDDATGRLSDSHPLREVFRPGTRVANLDRSPEAIHLAGGTAFLRRAEVERLGLRFDVRLRPNFEDTALIARYLLHADPPTIGFVADAHYHYRKRADASGSVQSSGLRHEKYTVVPARGYLATLRHAAGLRGSVPRWLQNVVLYELFWYLRDHDRSESFSRVMPAEVQREFHRLVRLVTAHISAEAVTAFAVRPVAPHVRRALLLGYKDTAHRPGVVVLDELDRARQLVRLRYRYSGEDPDVRVLVDGRPVRPRHGTTVSHVYFGATLYREGVRWVPAGGTLRVEVEGHPVPLSVRESADRRHELTTSEVSRRLARRSRSPGRRGRRRFRHAWVLVDHPERAGDNAEFLYRHLRRDRPATNAWFALRRDSPDWARLGADGFRLVELGSAAWAQALRHADHLAASHLEVEVLRALRAARREGGGLRFTFLQRGPRGHEPAPVLNGKPVDLLVTATPEDCAALTGHGSPYAFTTKEVRLTGLPRHDALMRLSRQHGGTRPAVVLVPTFDGPVPTEEWTALLCADRLHALCRRYGVAVTVLADPSSPATTAGLGLPHGVRVVAGRYPGRLEALAHCAVLVTGRHDDAYDAAYLGRPVVYAHLGRWAPTQPDGTPLDGDAPGDLGPVATDVESVLLEVDRALSHPRALSQDRTHRPYASGAQQTFPYRDGGCCARIVAEMDLLHPPPSAGHRVSHR